MNRSRQLAAGWISAALLAAIVLLTMFVLPALADTTSKPYAVVIAPGTVPAGSTATFTATLTNETATQQLGSANVTLPAGFTALAVGSSPVGTAALNGSTIMLRDLATPPGASTAVSVIVKVPCSPVTSTWSVIAKQSNNFTGEPGNDMTFDPTHSSLTTTLTGACHLGIEFTSQPADTQIATVITTATFDPSGPPVSVRVLDGNGDPITSSTAPITLALGSNPGGGILSGMTTVNAVGGSASFPGIAIDEAGLGYTLAASTSATDINPTVSGSFNIANVGKQCAAASCSSGTVTEGSTAASETASAGSPGDLLSLYVAVEPLDCPGYTETSAVVTFDVSGIRTKSVTITVPKAGLKVAKMRVCFSSPNAFLNRSGQTVNLGLLPDCSIAAAPCVTSIKVVKNEIRAIFQAPAGDPKGRV